MQDDAELLRRYAEERSQEAFSEIVCRYLNLVYSAAVRQTSGDEHLARDISQVVFTGLARKAAALSRHPALVGWLYRSTRYAAIDALRAQQRRRQREAEMMQELPDTSEPYADWEQFRPVIDEAMSELNERDRHAVLLRFFEGRSFAEVGADLQLNENAARMRVERALDKLRLRLARRGWTSTATALAVALTDHAVTAAPAGLSAAVTNGAIAGSASTGGTLATLQLLTMSKLNIALISGVVTAGIVTAVLTWRAQPAHREIAMLRYDTERLQQELQRRQAQRAAHTTVASAAGAGTLPGAFGDIASRVEQRRAEVRGRAATKDAAKVESPGAYRNLGQAIPEEAYQTFAWASDCGDIAILSKLICFEGDGRKTAESVLASMPESVRAKWSTPEELYALFIAADSLSYPPPRADVLSRARAVPLAPDRVVFGRSPLAPSGGQEYQKTPEGWKYVFPEIAVKGFTNQMMEMADALAADPKAGPEKK